MARIKKQLTELIGHTPLLSLDRIKQHHQVEGNLIAKLEFFNPGGSVKDRPFSYTQWKMEIISKR